MAKNFNNRHYIHQCIAPISVTSDGKIGTAVQINGYNRAFIRCNGGLQTAGDSDDTFTFQLYVDATKSAASDWATSDATAITAGLVTLAAPADSDTAFGSQSMELDTVTHSITTGLINVFADASAGLTSPASVDIFLYRPNKSIQDSDNPTCTYPAAS